MPWGKVGVLRKEYDCLRKSHVPYICIVQLFLIFSYSPYNIMRVFPYLIPLGVTNIRTAVHPWNQTNSCFQRLTFTNYRFLSFAVIKELVHAFSCAYIEKWMHLGSLESAQDARVCSGLRLEQLSIYTPYQIHAPFFPLFYDLIKKWLLPMSQTSQSFVSLLVLYVFIVTLFSFSDLRKR